MGTLVKFTNFIFPVCALHFYFLNAFCRANLRFRRISICLYCIVSYVERWIYEFGWSKSVISTINRQSCIAALVIFLIIGRSTADTAKIEGSSKEKWHFDSPTKQSEAAGYAQVVKFGDTLYVSGVPTNDLSEEGVKRLYETIEESLVAFGASTRDIVKETLFTTDIDTMASLNNVRKSFYKGDYPASSWVQVDRLFMPDAKLEVEVIARLPINID